MSHGIEAGDLICKCDRPARFLCDYPMGQGRTCDMNTHRAARGLPRIEVAG